MNSLFSAFFYLSIFQLLIMSQVLTLGPEDPTKGFIALPFDTSYYHIQKPYDLSVDQRYSFVNGTHYLWVFSTDKPHSITSRTHPRTEIAIQGYNYSSGVWQFEGHFYVPSGTSGVCIMQVFGASLHATTLMLRVYNGTLMYYNHSAILSNVYDKWFHLNVIHDVDASKVNVFIDGYLKYEASGRGGTSHTFKCGVYAQDDDSYYMESRWRNITILRKCD